MRRVIERLWAQIGRPSPAIADLDLFRLCPPVRVAEVAHRLLYVGDLSPTSSAPDVLIALAGWAETHPHERAEIWWAADGDLSGILAAQPLPPNLAQQFQGTVTREELPELMARCGILVASGHAATEDAPVVEAWAAGLIVLASRRMVPARFRLQGDGPAWLFDPARPNGLAEALEQVLACDPARLDELREQGQRLVSDRVVYEVDSSDVADVLSHRPMASSGALTS